MNVPEELGRIARGHNHEAMAFMKEAQGHILSAKKLVRAVLRLEISDEVRDFILDSLDETDLALVTLVNASYHQREIEGIMDQNATRGHYNKEVKE